MRSVNGTGFSGLRLTTARRQWVYIVGAWTLIWLFNAEQSHVRLVVAGRTAEWKPLLLAYLPGTVMWALVTPLVIALALRFPLDRDRWPRSLLVHLPVAFAIAVAEAALYQLLDP